MPAFRLILMIAAALLATLAPARADTKPNIIYILADDLGYGELGCYGQEKIKTPCLDQIAAEGMRFTQHYSGAAVCAPSRFTLMTGKHIGRSFTTGQRQALEPQTLTIQNVARQAGYKTASIGKWGLGEDPMQQGNDKWYGFLSQGYAHYFYPERIWMNDQQVEIPANAQKNGLRVDGRYTEKIKDGVYIHDEFTREAMSFISENQDTPFLLYLPYTIPHLELVVPEDSLAEYRGKFPEDRPFDTIAMDRQPAGGNRFYDGYGYCSADTPRATYAAMITRMDRDIGRIMALLIELNLDENTIVMFSSDNGPSQWDAGGTDRDFFNSNGELRSGKGTYYEGGLRVPMLARWPGKIQPGSVTDHISYFPDVLPTIAELVGVEVSESVDGLSLVPTLLGTGQQQEHEFLYWAASMRMGKWKYVHGGKEYDGPKGGGQLFNLEDDPGETEDLAMQYPEIVSKFIAIHEQSRNPISP